MQQEIYYRIYRFWAKIFAINFVVGVVSGILLESQFGTHFSRFSQAVANVFSPLLAHEGMTAFFLEAGFLGIMLFGWKRAPRGVHFLATCLVALGGGRSAGDAALHFVGSRYRAPHRDGLHHLRLLGFSRQG